MSDPSPPYQGKITLNYELPSILGWTEAVWINKPTFNASLAALKELANCRLEILPKGIRLVNIRITNPNLPKASVGEEMNQIGLYENAKGAHMAWTTLLLRLQNSKGYYTRYNLGGIPKDLTEASGIHPAATWQAAFDKFVEAMKTHCVMVNRIHQTRGADRNENALEKKIVNAIDSVFMMKKSSRKRGVGHSYPRKARRV